MDKTEIKKAFIENIERERVKRGWTQQEMAEKIDMSAPGYRKMVSGNTDSISLTTAYNCSKVLNVTIPILCGSKELRDKVANDLHHTSESICRRTEYYISYSNKVNEARANYYSGKRIIDVFTMQGYLTDGMYLNSRTVEKKLIPNKYGDRVIKGFRINENSFLPAYAKGDVLIVEETTSRDGDITLVLHLPTNRVYLRKIVFAEQYELHPINNRGAVIYIPREERYQWFDYGPVIGYLREEDLMDVEI